MIITVRPVPVMAVEFLENGAKAITVEDLRWKRCDIKTIQLLPNAWAKQQAKQAGADDAIFVSSQGVVREGTSSNVFKIREGIVETHPLSPRILPGITRQYLLSICKNHGIPAVEKTFDITSLWAADEVFLSGTVTEVLPVTSIDGKTIGNGKPGPITQNLFTLLRKAAGAE